MVKEGLRFLFFCSDRTETDRVSVICCFSQPHLSVDLIGC